MGLFLYWFDEDTSALLSVNFDVNESENHELATAITTHPVEDGIDIADNAKIEPAKISIDGYVSNKPLPSNLDAKVNPARTKSEATLLQLQTIKLELPKKLGGAPIYTPGGLTHAVTSAITDLFHPPDNSAGVYKSPDGTFPDRATAVYETLVQARKTRALITVVTSMATLENMMIANIGLPRTPEDGNGAKFVLELTEVRFAQSSLVSAPKPAEARGLPQAPKGKQTTKEPDKGPGTTLLGAADGATGGAISDVAGGIGQVLFGGPL